MRLPLPLSAFAVLLLGCPGTPTGDDDASADDDSTAADDDTSGDDDSASALPSWTWDRTDLTAGAWERLTVTIENFDISPESLDPGEAAEILLVSNFDEGDDNVYAVALLPGMLASGTVSFSVTGPDGTLSQEFEVTAITPEVLVEGQPGGSGLIDPDYDADVWSLATSAGETWFLRAGNPGNEDFFPYIWVFGPDGKTRLGAAVPDGADPEAPYPIFTYTAEEDGTIFVRVDDMNWVGGSDFSYDLDAAKVPTPVPGPATIEVEPNDAFGEWQDLGELAIGSWVIEGEVTTVGNDGDQRPTGDIDGFTFTVAVPSSVSFELSWADLDTDLDAPIFDVTDGDVDLAWDAEEVIDTTMATIVNPEAVTLDLVPGTTYGIFVWGWEGNPDAWSLDVMVLAPPFAD